MHHLQHQTLQLEAYRYSDINTDKKFLWSQYPEWCRTTDEGNKSLDSYLKLQYDYMHHQQDSPY